MAKHDPAVEILALALGVESARIDNSFALGRSAEWDSIAHMNIILAVEKALERRLTPDAVLALENLQSLRNILMEE
ncbi:hypothetical protein GCM10007939_17400 [Amylibacter marinus]|uniref:Acyl carrier protein n=1 Tax=Amylibacter marinus TaxID=1475483 RepID=A0ABQ5VVK0_9RHOB|nr:acyl carrier protein [Amylibacter marinus]GLQ35457.1 hypothetical protein GCM10007939_17400 [Amylibacter marinus]